MYNSFFGFKERPFMLTPNPAYLFLSRSHEEALAHLTYAVTQGEGFVEITGEVGTGKTTLCRVFLEKLDDSIEAAYLFNPMLNSVQLLKSINSEFGVRSDLDNTKDLIDSLNEFLIQKKSLGKKVIILVDEAQNLSLDVLEQLRLLSNLETTTSKLLQIILVGQPELREKLDSRELRQLAQRITLSCHLSPMTYEETRDYIQHRLQVASHKTGPKFTRSAVKTIFSFSGGIPRLINIVCDRSLLIAYGLNSHKITGSISKAAVRELTSRADLKHRAYQDRKAAVLLLSLLSAILLMVILNPEKTMTIGRLWTKLEEPAASNPGQTVSTPVSLQSTTTAPPSEIKLPEQKELPIDQIPPAFSDQQSVNSAAVSDSLVTDTSASEAQAQVDPIQLSDFLKTWDHESSKTAALEAVAELWQIQDIKFPEFIGSQSDDMFFTLAASQNGFMLYRIDNFDLDLLLKLNLPSIFAVRPDRHSKQGYITLAKLQHDQFIFKSGKEDTLISADLNQIRNCWIGTAIILWKNFYNYTGIIPKDAPPESILSLKMHLREIGFTNIQLNSIYDALTQKAIESIQKKHTIVVDGVAGPLTKIILYNETKSLTIPHLNSNTSQDTGGKP